MKNIVIRDTGKDRYKIITSHYILGRMYDNNAEQVSVKVPECENESVCTMIVSANGKIIDHIVCTEDRPISITDNLSQYKTIKIGFSFSRSDGYIKNSEIKEFKFYEAQKPGGFTPSTPEQKTNIDYLIGKGFSGSKIIENTLFFYNVHGEIACTVDLSQYDVYIPTKTSELENDSDFVDSKYVDENGGKIDSISVNGEKQNIGSDKNVDLLIPTKTSELENDKKFITETDGNNKVDKLLSKTTNSITQEISILGSADATNLQIGLTRKNQDEKSGEPLNKAEFFINTNDFNSDITISLTNSDSSLGKASQLTLSPQAITFLNGDNVGISAIGNDLDVHGSEVNVIGNLNVNGNITQKGEVYETHAEKVFTTNDYIVMRDGAKDGLASGYSGFEVKLYDGAHDGRLVLDANGIARVGDVGEEQPLATREETPLENGFARWNATLSRYDSVELSSSVLSDKDSLVKQNDISNMATVDTAQTFTAAKTFNGQLGVANAKGAVDYLEHLNNNLLISSSAGTNLLNIDEQSQKVYFFNKEIAYKEDIPETQGELTGYLPLTGGTLTGTSGDTPLKLRSNAASSYLGFVDSNNADLGYLGVNSNKKPVFYDTSEHQLAYASELSNYLSLTGGTMNLTKDVKMLSENRDKYLIADLLSFREANPTYSPEYLYTGFYQYNDTWQVTRRDANNVFQGLIFDVNLKNKNATFYGNLGVYGDILKNTDNGNYRIAIPNKSGTLALTSDTAPNSELLHNNSAPGQSNVMQYMQISGNNDTGDNPQGTWSHIIKMNHGNGDTYFNRTLAFDFFSNKIWTRRRDNGNAGNWTELLLAEDIASADENYSITYGSTNGSSSKSGTVYTLHIGKLHIYSVFANLAYGQYTKNSNNNQCWLHLGQNFTNVRGSGLLSFSCYQSGGSPQSQYTNSNLVSSPCLMIINSSPQIIFWMRDLLNETNTEYCICASYYILEA